MVLNIDEAEDYFDSDEDRIAYPTPYVAAQGIHISEIGSAWWWLRSPGKSGSFAARVRTNGEIKYDGIEVTDHCGMIRPVVVFKID